MENNKFLLYNTNEFALIYWRVSKHNKKSKKEVVILMYE